MKNSIVIFFFLAIASVAVAQNIKPLHNDTIVCIVDTSNYFTSYTENPYKKLQYFHWLVGIKGHYYDHKSPEDADFALIGFSTDFRKYITSKDSLKIEVPLNSLEERFTVVTDLWLNEQKSLNTIHEIVGFAPWIKYNFIIFKSEIESSTNGKVFMYRVLVGYNEVQY